MKRAIFIGVLFVLFSQVCKGQWRKIYDFSTPIKCIYFQDHTKTPTIGFVGLGNTMGSSAELWRTSNSGVNWQEIFVPPNGNGFINMPHSFSFRDSMTGWYSSFAYPDQGMHQTLDGGLNWSIPLGPAALGGVFYNHMSNRIFCAVLGPTYCFSDDGVNFTYANLNDTYGTVGIAFSDSLHGVMTAVKSSPIQSKILPNYIPIEPKNWRY